MRTIGSFWSVLLSFWAAVVFCVGYAFFGYLLIRAYADTELASRTVRFFIFDYGGLIAGSACAALFLMSVLVLRMIPQLIEEAISSAQIKDTGYDFWKARFDSSRLGVAQFATYFLGGFAIYSLLQFQVRDDLQIFFVVFTSLQYGFGGFIGRKLWCVGHMLRSLENVKPRNNLLEIEALPRLIYVVNIFTFLTLMMTIIHTYFHAQLEYRTSFDVVQLLRPFVYLPLVLAIPVIILFNFYPRMVVNRLYLRSIRQRKDWLSRKMQKSGEPEIAQLKHTIDYEKYLNEEFRYRQHVALSELPVALTITVAVIVTVVRILAN